MKLSSLGGVILGVTASLATPSLAADDYSRWLGREAKDMDTALIQFDAICQMNSRPRFEGMEVSD